jgi:hypothetical protein
MGKQGISSGVLNICRQLTRLRYSFFQQFGHARHILSPVRRLIETNGIWQSTACIPLLFA